MNNNEYIVNKEHIKGIGIKGWILILCIIEIFIAKYFTIVKLGVLGVSEINLIILILFFMVGVRISIERKKLVIKQHDYIILFFLVYIFFSIIISCYFYKTSYLQELIYFKNYLNPFIIFFLVKNAIDSKNEARAVICLLIIILVVSCIYALIPYFIKGSTDIIEGDRTTGIVGEANVFGMYILFTLPFLILEPSKNRTKKDIIKICAIIIVNIALVQTGSRGSFVALSLFYFLFLIQKKKRTKTVLAGIVVAILLTVITTYQLFGETNVLNRLLYRNIEQKKIAGSFDLDEYSSKRLTLWNFALSGFKEKPITGHGFHNFKRLLEKKYFKGVTAHNQYLNHLFELGIIGFTLFIAIYYNIWNYFKKNKKSIIGKSGYYAIIGLATTMMFIEISTASYPIWITLAVSIRYLDFEKI